MESIWNLDVVTRGRQWRYNLTNVGTLALFGADSAGEETHYDMNLSPPLPEILDQRANPSSSFTKESLFIDFVELFEGGGRQR